MTEERTRRRVPPAKPVSDFDVHLVKAMAAILGLELDEARASAALSILAPQLEQGMQVPPEALQHLEPATQFSARWS